MTYSEAKQLKNGDRVIWDKNREDLGTVETVGNAAVKIEWDNGMKGWVDFEDAKRIEKAVTS